LLFAKVTQIEPGFHGGWVNLGGSDLSTGRFAEVLEANTRALALQPDNPLVNSQVGLSYYYQRQYAEAEKYFKRVIGLDPSFANLPQLYLVHISLAQHRDHQAAEYIRAFVELHPNAPHLQMMLTALMNGTIIHAPDHIAAADQK
jgi:tetratricopeptide (TPR) repeat protein